MTGSAAYERPYRVAVVLPDDAVVVLPASGLVSRLGREGVLLTVAGAVPGWPDEVVAVPFTHGDLAAVLAGSGSAGALVVGRDDPRSPVASPSPARRAGAELAEVELFGDPRAAERAVAASAAARTRAPEQSWAVGAGGTPARFPVRLVHRPDPYLDTLVPLERSVPGLPLGGFLVRERADGTFDAWPTDDLNDQALADSVRAGRPAALQLTVGSWEQTASDPTGGPA